MSGARLEGDFPRLRSALLNLEHFDKLGLNEAIGETLKASTRERFRDEKDPEGDAWKESARAKLEGGKTLTDESTLKNSINARASSDGAAVGTNDIRAGTHQFGSENEPGGVFKIKAKSGNKKGLRFKIAGRWISKREVTVKMPKRAFLGLSDSDMDQIEALTQQAIGEHVNE